jgi:hypothetical protein
MPSIPWCFGFSVAAAARFARQNLPWGGEIYREKLSVNPGHIE